MSEKQKGGGNMKMKWSLYKNSILFERLSSLHSVKSWVVTLWWPLVAGRAICLWSPNLWSLCTFNKKLFIHFYLLFGWHKCTNTSQLDDFLACLDSKLEVDVRARTLWSKYGGTWSHGGVNPKPESGSKFQSHVKVVGLPRQWLLSASSVESSASASESGGDGNSRRLAKVWNKHITM